MADISDVKLDQSSTADSQKLGLMGLIGVVAGSMIGGGIFNLPSNMASTAGAGAVLIAWVVTAVGMYFLASTFKALSNARPDLSSGIYAYAREGFGGFMGFEMAWGYWLSAAFGNVAFAVLIMDTLGYFFPVFKDGSMASLLGGSILIWFMHFVVLRGVSAAASLNVVATIAKLVPAAVIIIALIVAFDANVFQQDFWGHSEKIGSPMEQMKGTMLVTLWAFIGIEGAVVVSGRAKNPKSVGAATLAGLFLCLFLYVLISVLPFGIMHEPEMAGLKNPSAAYVLEKIVGPWGATFVNAGVLIALLSCWLSWTILVPEVPFEAAKGGAFPKKFAEVNTNGSPAIALWVSSIVMQIMLVAAHFSSDAWNFLLSITGVMVLPPYLASAAFLCQYSKSHGNSIAFVTGLMASIYAVWLLYAAGPSYLLMSTVIFALGIAVYWMSYKEKSDAGSFLQGNERWIATLLILVAIASIAMFAMGKITI